MKILIIGAVAAGTSAAAQIMRNDPSAEVVLYERDQDISYSSCGLPYYLGGKVELEQLTPRTPEKFQEKYGVTVRTGHEVKEIDPKNRTISGVRSDGSSFEDNYDELVIATGAHSILPKIPGVEDERVFTLRTVEDTREIMNFIEEKSPGHVIIVGTGFIGLELLENFCERDMQVVLLNRSDRITPHLDEDMAAHLEELIRSRGVELRKNTEIKEITREGADTGDEVLPADLIIFATGIRPDTKLANSIGVDMTEKGAVIVDDQMRTNVERVWACGDAVQLWSVLDQKPLHVPLGTSANKTGKVCGDAITGGNLRFRGILGTSIFRLFDLTIGTTGYSERQAKDMGYEVEVICQEGRHRAGYFDGEKMQLKAVADKKTARLLGVQIIGKHGVDKRIDVFVTAITNQMSGADIYNLDLAYAPPYSTVNDIIHHVGLKLRAIELSPGDDA